MELTKQAINQYASRIDGLRGYELIVSKVERNITENPDIAIESCRSLIEGLGKKALELLCARYQESKSLRKDCENSFTVLVSTAFNEIFAYTIEAGVFEHLSNALDKISALRNTRGDISHGRAYPKQVESTVALARSVALVTDGISSLMIYEIAMRLPEAAPEETLDYKSEQMAPFNNWLDESIEDFPIKTVRYSEILFEKDYDAYKEIYEDEYLRSLEPLKVVKHAPATRAAKLAKSKKRPVVEVLSVDFDEDAFWTPERLEEVRAFAEKEEFDFERMKQFINDYLAFERPPRPDDLFSAYMGEMHRVKDWLIVRDEMMERLVPLLEKYDRESYEVLARKKAESSKGV
jgi:hypothetical protein